MLRKSLPLAAALILALSAIAHSQESQTAPQEGMRPGREGHREGKRHGRMGGPGRLGFMRELNLTEEQLSQQRAIVQRHLASTKGQREELFNLREKRIAGTFTDEDIARVKVLRQEMRNSMEGIRTEMEGVLTSEQRARLEQLKAERKARHDEMRERFRERREAVPR
jgi:Spy/CpxP family protein refolding chaperone